MDKIDPKTTGSEHIQITAQTVPRVSVLPFAVEAAINMPPNKVKKNTAINRDADIISGVIMIIPYGGCVRG